jgi:hypothetical protein
MKKATENTLINYFKNKEFFSRRDLFNYFLQLEGELNEGTFGWRIYDLKKKNILREIKRGLYTLTVKPIYIPAVDDNLIKLAEIFTSHYQDANCCLWNINWLNEFTVHQFNRDNILFETEKDLIESVAHTLADNGYSSMITYSHLISFTSSITPVILQSLISRSPLQHIETKEGKPLPVPTLEKILVDIYANENVFHFVQGAEMERIFQHAIDRYSINYTTFFGYAKRRGKETGLRAFLLNHFPELLKNIN